MDIFIINYNIILRSYQNKTLEIFPIRSFIMEVSEANSVNLNLNQPSYMYLLKTTDWPKSIEALP